jgi:lipopolysaccharide biosynthesis glycosyltransferase
MKIFIGSDSRHMKATRVCIQSIKNNSKKSDHKIMFLDKAKLKNIGVYGRDDVKGESTEFSFTRFYVPLLCNYEGIAMFCDNDFLWKCNPKEIEKYLNGKSIAVVKHEYYEPIKEKMDGIVNKNYPRKNWSSLILFDCSKLKQLSKDFLDSASPAALHQFEWLVDSEIAEIPRSYNHLVGHYKKHNKIKALHYTNGGPWFEEYKNAELSEEWWKVYETL